MAASANVVSSASNQSAAGSSSKSSSQQNSNPNRNFSGSPGTSVRDPSGNVTFGGGYGDTNKSYPASGGVIYSNYDAKTNPSGGTTTTQTGTLGVTSAGEAVVAKGTSETATTTQHLIGGGKVVTTPQQGGVFHVDVYNAQQAANRSGLPNATIAHPEEKIFLSKPIVELLARQQSSGEYGIEKGETKPSGEYLQLNRIEGGEVVSGFPASYIVKSTNPAREARISKFESLRETGTFTRFDLVPLEQFNAKNVPVTNTNRLPGGGFTQGAGTFIQPPSSIRAGQTFVGTPGVFNPATFNVLGVPGTSPNITVNPNVTKVVQKPQTVPVQAISISGRKGTSLSTTLVPSVPNKTFSSMNASEPRKPLDVRAASRAESAAMAKQNLPKLTVFEKVTKFIEAKEAKGERFFTGAEDWAFRTAHVTGTSVPEKVARSIIEYVPEQSRVVNKALWLIPKYQVGIAGAGYENLKKGTVGVDVAGTFDASKLPAVGKAFVSGYDIRKPENWLNIGLTIYGGVEALKSGRELIRKASYEKPKTEFDMQSKRAIYDEAGFLEQAGPEPAGLRGTIKIGLTPFGKMVSKIDTKLFGQHPFGLGIKVESYRFDIPAKTVAVRVANAPEITEPGIMTFRTITSGEGTFAEQPYRTNIAAESRFAVGTGATETRGLAQSTMILDTSKGKTVFEQTPTMLIQKAKAVEAPISMDKLDWKGNRIKSEYVQDVTARQEDLRADALQRSIDTGRPVAEPEPLEAGKISTSNLGNKLSIDFSGIAATKQPKFLTADAILTRARINELTDFLKGKKAGEKSAQKYDIMEVTPKETILAKGVYKPLSKELLPIFVEDITKKPTFKDVPSFDELKAGQEFQKFTGSRGTVSVFKGKSTALEVKRVSPEVTAATKEANIVDKFGNKVLEGKGVTSTAEYLTKGKGLGIKSAAKATDWLLGNEPAVKEPARVNIPFDTEKVDWEAISKPQEPTKSVEPLPSMTKSIKAPGTVRGAFSEEALNNLASVMGEPSGQKGQTAVTIFEEGNQAPQVNVWAEPKSSEAEAFGFRIAGQDAKALAVGELQNKGAIRFRYEHPTSREGVFGKVRVIPAFKTQAASAVKQNTKVFTAYGQKSEVAQRTKAVERISSLNEVSVGTKMETAYKTDVLTKVSPITRLGTDTFTATAEKIGVGQKVAVVTKFDVGQKVKQKVGQISENVQYMNMTELPPGTFKPRFPVFIPFEDLRKRKKQQQKFPFKKGKGREGVPEPLADLASYNLTELRLGTAATGARGHSPKLSGKLRQEWKQVGGGLRTYIPTSEQRGMKIFSGIS